VTLFFLVRSHERKRERERFLPEAQQLIQRFIRNVQSDLEALTWCGRLFAASTRVEPIEFNRFLRLPHPWNSEVESLEWIPRVSALQREEFERTQGLRIVEPDAEGRMVPAANVVGDYFPQHYFECEPGRAVVPRLGFNHRSDLESSNAIYWAIQTTNGDLVATSPLEYPPAPGQKDAAVKVRVFLPIYANEPNPDLPPYHPQNLEGFVAMTLIPGELLRRVQADRTSEKIELRLFDEGSMRLGERAASSIAHSLAAPEVLVTEQTEAIESASMDVGGRLWTIRCQSRGHLVSGVQWEAWLVLAGGLVLTALLSSYLYTLLGQAAYIENVVTRRTRELASMNVRLQNEIAERERGERALRNSEALYHSLVDTLPLNVLRKNLAGEITFGNRQYCETIKQPMESILGKTDFDLFPKALAEKYVADDRRVAATRQVFEDVEEHRKPDGTMVYMHVLKAPVTDALGKVVGTQVIFWDVTEKRRAEEALQQTLADLARSNRDLEQFAYVASHDLQEPLRMIASYTELLAKRYRNKLDQEAQEFIKFVVDGAVRMQMLISDLLVYSRLSTHGTPFAPTDCEEVLREALANLQMAIDESCALVTHDPLPPVMADHMQLVQLFQNFISNAIKFRGPASPEIHISAQQQGQEWIMSVRDNGLGIDPKFAERIFVIFQRLHARDKYPGTGIGLAICKKIIERHGGHIWVESEAGRGSTFYFTLPVLRPSGGD
jgi:PAS domain S-box-containing protein